MLPWLGELVGRLLWRSEDVGLRFVGAMLSVGMAVAGIFLYARKRF